MAPTANFLGFPLPPPRAGAIVRLVGDVVIEPALACHRQASPPVFVPGDDVTQARM